MGPYLALLTVPSVFALFHHRRVSPVLYALVLAIFVFFVGFRHQVGVDWFTYVRIHDGVAGIDPVQILLWREPLSFFLFWLSENAGFHLLLTNIAAALILMAGIVALARKSANPWLAVVACTPYLIIAFGMSGIRQGMAIGILFFAFSFWWRIGNVKRTCFVILASLFHTSSLVGGIFIISSLKIRLIYRVILSSVTFVVGFSVIRRDDTLPVQFGNKYDILVNNVISPGSLFHIALVLIPGILGLLLWRHLARFVPDPRFLKFGIYCTIGVLVTNFFSTVVASRLTLYLYFVPMMIYPAITHAFGPRSRPALTMLVVIAHFVILVAWFTFGNNTWTHLPYRNVLFQLS